MTHQPAICVGRFHDDGTFEETDYIDPAKIANAIFSGRAAYQVGANRSTRRAAAVNTRLKNGKPRIDPPMSRRQRNAMPPKERPAL